MQLGALPFPVYFSLSRPEGLPLPFDGADPATLAEAARANPTVENNWITRTYLELASGRASDIHLCTGYPAGKIVVRHTEALGIKDFSSMFSYLVVVRGDRGRPRLGRHSVVQNQGNVLEITDHFVPHWPQLGLRPRDPGRGNRLERMGYMGSESLAPEFLTTEFRAELRAAGMDDFDPEVGTEDWGDFRSMDVFVAVRDGTAHYLSKKPASKLVNAWMAGVPALLGPEPAYRWLRRSDLDYIEVRTPADVIQAIRFLRDNPSFYSAMVENGRRRAEEFTAEAIRLQWFRLLEGPVAEGYARWLDMPGICKFFERPLRHCLRALPHAIARRRHWERSKGASARRTGADA